MIDIGTHYFDLIGWFLNFPKIKKLSKLLFKENFFQKKIQTSPFKKFENEEMATDTLNLTTVV